MSRSTPKPMRRPGTVLTPEPMRAVKVGVDVYIFPGGDEVRLADAELAATWVAK